MKKERKKCICANNLNINLHIVIVLIKEAIVSETLINYAQYMNRLLC